MRARIIAAAAVATLLLAGPASGATRISPEEFAANIERARAIAVTGESKPSRERMLEVSDALGLPVDVEFSWGLLTITPDITIESLEGRSARDFARAVEHLDALTDELREAEGAEPRDRAELRMALQSSFQGITASRSWIQIIRERIGEAIGAVVERVARATASGFGLIAAILVLIALVALAISLIFLRLRVVPDHQIRRHGEQGVRPDWRVLAAEAEARGDLEGAVRAHYQILLDELARRGIVEDEPSLTAGECRSAVAGARPLLYAVIADATDAFERVAYGHTSPRAEHIERLRRATEAARAA